MEKWGFHPLSQIGNTNTWYKIQNLERNGNPGLHRPPSVRQLRQPIYLPTLCVGGSLRQGRWKELFHWFARILFKISQINPVSKKLNWKIWQLVCQEEEHGFIGVSEPLPRLDIRMVISPEYHQNIIRISEYHQNIIRMVISPTNQPLIQGDFFDWSRPEKF